MSDNNPTEKKLEALEVHLAEYERIWDEVYARFENQRQSFNYLITLLAAIATLLASNTIKLDPKLFFWFPLIIAPFSFIFFDNELMIWAIVKYTKEKLRERVTKLVGDEEVLTLENQRFTNLKIRKIHRLLSVGRWLLFILPIFISLWYASFNTYKWWMSNYVFLFLLDCLIIVLIFLAIVCAARQQDLWNILKADSFKGRQAS